MGRIGSNSEISEGEKSELVLQICSMSTIPIACPHKNHSNNTHFIDWYRLLGVAENAGFQLIKRRYHNLALQLHPDKNKHPKAEIAFKLVSEVRFTFLLFFSLHLILE
ncbi:putative Penguin [Hibiscus syriacus]|uniref:Penguin n=1 Tax=Hibiscus syriacus TaxID=106335 RepID=A0A6A2ZHK3_HIBSY|nr:putative Penguin [Hibiscus syriacus]